jgi:hypothetical protein
MGTPRLSFGSDVHEDGRTGVLPLVDGTSLVDLITTYEIERGFEPLGGYAGLVRNALPVFLTKGRVALLGCVCGDMGCWPLEAMVHPGEQTVTWSGFRQPHRPDRDYSGFGPFTFDRAPYTDAVRTAGLASR